MFMIDDLCNHAYIQNNNKKKTHIYATINLN